MSNCLIALKFDTGKKYEKLDAQMLQWLDENLKGVCEDTFCIPQFFEIISTKI